jgi:hypothetical protein
MTQQELIDLEVERLALLRTVEALSKDDARMDTILDELVCDLEKRVQEIQQLIAQELKSRQ